MNEVQLLVELGQVQLNIESLTFKKEFLIRQIGEVRLSQATKPTPEPSLPAEPETSDES